MSRDNIVLDLYLRVGDRVVMQMDPEARGWGRPGAPDGTIGTVIGFTRHERHIPRVGGFGQKPGVYMCNGVGVVAWDTGQHDTPGAGDLVWLTDHDKRSEERRKDKAWNDAFETKQFISDLPNLPFWEHDIVRDKTGRVQMGNRTDGLLRIMSIEYHHLNSKRDDGSPMPIYNVEAPEGRSGYTWTDNDDLELVERGNDDLELVERGNVWKWFNGERANIKWKDLHEEAGFHKWLGACDEIRNPRTSYYTWELQDIRGGLEDGLIDAPSISRGFFGAGPALRCHKFHDRDLGERVRAEALNGFR
jgi:hypothetical protein